MASRDCTVIFLSVYNVHANPPLLRGILFINVSMLITVDNLFSGVRVPPCPRPSGRGLFFDSVVKMPALLTLRAL